MINEFIKFLPVEMTADEFIAIVLFVSVILGIFEACHNEAQKCERFFIEQKQRGGKNGNN